MRWAYDEPRDPNEEGEEHFAAVMRSGTSRLLNLKAAHLKRRVLRGDLVSAFLHIFAKKKFSTRFPKGHPEEYDAEGLRQALLWGKLLYGKGTASRGLWHDSAATLIAVGFEQHSGVDQCLFVHRESGIDFGLYVGDCEMSGTEKDLAWLQAQLEKRYEVKWLVYNSKNCAESSEKSKIFVGIRTEIDHSNQTVTQDQEQLIRKAAARYKWDGVPRYSPPVSDGPFPELAHGAKIDPIFHQRYRSKVGFVAHVAVKTRFDINHHAVKFSQAAERPGASV